MPVFSEVAFHVDRPLHVPRPHLRVIQREFHHDVASVKLVAPVNRRHLEKDTPITVRWGRAPRGLNTLVGYINHTEPIQTPSREGRGQFQIKLVGVSAATALKKPLQQTWQDRNIPSIVRGLLRDHQLSGVVQDHPQVFESLSCNGQSTWAFLVSLAQRLGWTVRSQGTDVYFQDPLNDVINQRAQAPLFTVAGEDGGSLISFQVIDGHTEDGGVQAQRIASGLDPRQLQVLTVEDSGAGFDDRLGRFSTPPTTTVYSGFSGSSYGAALQTMEGEAKRNRWHIQARAEVSGDTHVFPGMLISIRAARPKESGYWYVEAAEHEIDQDGYRMALTLGRDSTWDTGERPERGRYRRVVRSRNDPFGSQRDEPPPAILVNGRWRAAWGQPVRLVPTVVEPKIPNYPSTSNYPSLVRFPKGA